MSEQLDLIQAGELDAGLVILPVADDSLEVEPVLCEPVIAAVPEQHCLAMKKTVSLQELSELPLISLSKRLHPHCYEHIHLRCIEQGYEPRIAQEVSSFPEAMALVADGAGFAFTRDCYERFRCPGVVFKKIEGQPRSVAFGQDLLVGTVWTSVVRGSGNGNRDLWRSSDPSFLVAGRIDNYLCELEAQPGGSQGGQIRQRAQSP